MKNKMFFVLKLAMALLGLALVAFGAQGPNENALNSDNPRVREMIAAQEEATDGLMALPDVLGTAVGLDDDGELAILVFVNLEGNNPAASGRNIPKNFRNKRIRVQFTEPFRAVVGQPVAAAAAASHTAKQDLPIQLGTSGGWGYDRTRRYCCSGTLGALIQTNGFQYILSNYHVFEGDIVAGVNGVAKTGDPIIQPGLVDVGCSAARAQEVGTLVQLSSLPGSNVDASIAQVLSGSVDPTGAILEIGTISNQALGAALNQAVKKSGRTTGLTHSYISGLNGRVSVAYDKECGGGRAFTKTFTNQILIANSGSGFLNSGDSGSLMVEDVSTNPKAVGLLFAGSNTLAVANPINEVLTFIGTKLKGTATMVGK